MSDPIFADPRLAPIYDAFDGERDDLPAYAALADASGARTVLDVGCGTGNLALLLAARGLSVVGVDPAEASLAVARAKPGAAAVTWLHGDATTLPPLACDLAVMTGNVAQVFLTDEAWEGTLRGIHGALRAGGRLVFESRRPEHRVWEEWALDTAVYTLDVPGVGTVERRFEVVDVSPPFVSFRYTYRFATGAEDADGAEGTDGTKGTEDTVAPIVVSDSTLRFRGRDELAHSLTEAGFQVLDVRDAPDRPGREYVFIAQKAAFDDGTPARPGDGASSP